MAFSKMQSFRVSESIHIYSLQWYKSCAKRFTNIISFSPHNNNTKELESSKGTETDVTTLQWAVRALPSYLILSPIFPAFNNNFPRFHMSNEGLTALVVSGPTKSINKGTRCSKWNLLVNLVTYGLTLGPHIMPRMWAVWKKKIHGLRNRAVSNLTSLERPWHKRSGNRKRK